MVIRKANGHAPGKATGPGAARSAAALIDAFGGNGRFARRLDLPASTVGEMRASGAIKVDHWPAILKLARRRADLAWVTPAALMKLYLERRGRPDRPAAGKDKP